MPTVKYEFVCTGASDIAREFRAITAAAREATEAMSHPVLGSIVGAKTALRSACDTAIGRDTSPLIRALRWCKDRPWLVFFAGIVSGQAIVTVARML